MRGKRTKTTRIFKASEREQKKTSKKLSSNSVRPYKNCLWYKYCNVHSSNKMQRITDHCLSIRCSNLLIHHPPPSILCHNGFFSSFAAVVFYFLLVFFFFVSCFPAFVVVFVATAGHIWRIIVSKWEMKATGYLKRCTVTQGMCSYKRKSNRLFIRWKNGFATSRRVAAADALFPYFCFALLHFLRCTALRSLLSVRSRTLIENEYKQIRHYLQTLLLCLKHLANVNQFHLNRFFEHHTETALD